MHTVAAKPTYLSPDDVPDDVLSKERERDLVGSNARLGKATQNFGQNYRWTFEKVLRWGLLDRTRTSIGRGDTKSFEMFESIGINKGFSISECLCSTVKVLMLSTSNEQGITGGTLQKLKSSFYYIYDLCNVFLYFISIQKQATYIYSKLRQSQSLPTYQDRKSS